MFVNSNFLFRPNKHLWIINHRNSLHKIVPTLAILLEIDCMLIWGLIEMDDRQVGVSFDEFKLRMGVLHCLIFYFIRDQ